MELVEIALWTSSISLAIFGIVFGVIASINSRNANKQVQQLVEEQIISNEAINFFYEVPKKIGLTHRSLIDKYLTNKTLTWKEYGILTAEARFAPMSKRIIDFLSKTEYNDLVHSYIFLKERLDHVFKEVVEDLSRLGSSKPISESFKKKLIEYHKYALKETTLILKRYSILTKVSEMDNELDNKIVNKITKRKKGV